MKKWAAFIVILSTQLFSISNKGNDQSMQINKIALVTGASSGIGKALVVELLTRGYKVIGVSYSKDKLELVKQELSHPNFSVYTCDVSKSASVEQVSTALKKQHLVPSLFFLNAGIAGEAAMESIDRLETSHHKRMFEVNYFGVLNFIEQWLDPCKENKGATFVVSSSINAIFAPPAGSAYSASKAAIVKAFDGLRITHTGSNLHFLSIFCGPVDTPGLAGKLPFTWSAEKMATYMVDRAEKGKAHSYPSWFYTCLSKLLNLLPENQVLWVLKHLAGSEKKEA